MLIYKDFFKLILKSFLFLIIGIASGFIFFYFFKEQSVFLIEKFKILQNLFGIREYSENASYNYILITILLGNLISTICYLALGLLRSTLPISFITGFFMIIFLFSGTISHNASLPLEVIFLSGIEVFYRILSLSTGEFISRNKLKNKAIPVLSFVLIFSLYSFGIYYEILQIF